MTREEWLLQFVDELRPLFVENAGAIPERLRVTCGWPSKAPLSAKSRRLGECWLKGSADNTVEIFISPSVADGIEVGAILAHELVHACGHHGHKGPFKRLAVAIGLDGPMKSTKAGDGLKVRLNGIVERLGAYPHAVLDATQSPRKKEGTRLLKVICTVPECGYTIRTTQKWVQVGFPTCPCGGRMDLAEGEETPPEDDGE